MRDFVEALSQRWNRYVIGYDLPDPGAPLRRRGPGLRGLPLAPGPESRDPSTSSPALRPSLAGPSSSSPSGTSCGVAGRRASSPTRAQRSPRPSTRTSRTSPPSTRALEAALAPHGVYRPAFMPPLRHAESLTQQNHPLGPQVLELTMVYIEARFGGAFSEEERPTSSAALGRSAPRGRRPRTASTTCSREPRERPKGARLRASPRPLVVRRNASLRCRGSSR